MTAPDGTGWYSVAEAARLLDLKERAVRKRIAAGALVAERDGGGPWRVRLSAAQTAPHGTEDGTDRHRTAPVPHEVAYQVTPAVVEQAIARTGQQYTADLRAMLGELRQVYEGRVAAKDEALAAKDETIAELRRRAEAAEAEAAALRERVPAPVVALGAMRDTDSTAMASGAEQGAPGGRWARLTGWWRG